VRHCDSFRASEGGKDRRDATDVFSTLRAETPVFSHFSVEAK
jgi:hypothetical protein